jgi:hypothetical protein
MPEQSRPPPYRQMRFLILAVLVVAVVTGGVLGWQLLQPSPDLAETLAVPSVTTAQDWTDTTRSQLPSVASTTAKPESGVLWQKTGSDNVFGGSFKAPNRWRIVWSFNCRNFSTLGGGNFKLTGEGDFDDVSIQRFAVRASGTQRVTGGGHGRLVIESVCERWTVTAIAS